MNIFDENERKPPKPVSSERELDPIERIGAAIPVRTLAELADKVLKQHGLR